MSGVDYDPTLPEPGLRTMSGGGSQSVRCWMCATMIADDEYHYAVHKPNCNARERDCSYFLCEKCRANPAFKAYFIFTEPMGDEPEGVMTVADSPTPREEYLTKLVDDQAKRAKKAIKKMRYWRKFAKALLKNRRIKKENQKLRAAAGAWIAATAGAWGEEDKEDSEANNTNEP